MAKIIITTDSGKTFTVDTLDKYLMDTSDLGLQSTIELFKIIAEEVAALHNAEKDSVGVK